MIGYDVSWASFNILEVMTSKKFYHKRIGYLAAAQCFRPTTDILIMCTNLVRRVRTSPFLLEIMRKARLNSR